MPGKAGPWGEHCHTVGDSAGGPGGAYSPAGREGDAGERLSHFIFGLFEK